jgi:hypothetical protein
MKRQRPNKNKKRHFSKFCGECAMKAAIKNENQSVSLVNDQEKKLFRNDWNKGKLLGQKPPLKLK